MAHIVAVHNMTASSLADAKELGGLSRPSIAVLRDDFPFDDNGEISLIFRPEGLDPRVDFRNVLSNVDSFSNRSPPILYRFDAKEIQDAVQDTYHVRISSGIDRLLGKDTGYELSRQAENFRTYLVPGLHLSLADSCSFLMEHYAERAVRRDDAALYTESGRRRSFRQLTIPYTLNNVVDSMAVSRDPLDRNPGMMTWQMRMCGRAGSFDEIDDARLFTQREDIADYAQALDDYDSILCMIEHTLQNHGCSAKKASMILNEIRSPAPERIRQAFGRHGYRVSASLAETIAETGRMIRDLPVPYLELRPERAVLFDEVAAAVVPKDTSRELKDFLQQKGIYVSEYDEPYLRACSVRSAVMQVPETVIRSTERPRKISYDDAKRWYEEPAEPAMVAMTNEPKPEEQARRMRSIRSARKERGR